MHVVTLAGPVDGSSEQATPDPLPAVAGRHQHPQVGDAVGLHVQAEGGDQLVSGQRDHGQVCVVVQAVPEAPCHDRLVDR